MDKLIRIRTQYWLNNGTPDSPKWENMGRQVFEMYVPSDKLEHDNENVIKVIKNRLLKSEMSKFDYIDHEVVETTYLLTGFEEEYNNVTRKYVTNCFGEFFWTFNWTNGGLNDTWAKTKQDAIDKTRKKFSLETDENSYTKCTLDEMDNYHKRITLETC